MRTFIVFLLCLTLFPIKALAAPKVETTDRPTATPYRVVNLGTLGGDNNNAAAINNKGQVAGSAETANRNPHSIWEVHYSHAFLWDDQIMKDLGAPSGNDTSTISIAGMNNLGAVVGELHDSGNGGRNIAVLIADGKITSLAPPGSLSSSAKAINDQGQIVGRAQIGYRYIAMLWDHGKSMPVGNLGEGGVQANGINQHGQIVGVAVVAHRHDDWHGEVPIRRAVLWNNGARIDLGDLTGDPDSQSSVAFAINEIGQVVGESAPAGPSSSRRHAFLWTQGTMTDLGVLPGRSDSVARAINHLGQIVGSSEGGGFVRHPFIYDNGRMVARMVDLNSLIPADSGWELVDATGINDSGEICGFGWWRRTESRAFVLKLSGTAP